MKKFMKQKCSEPQGATDSTTYSPPHLASVRVYMVIVISGILLFYHVRPVPRTHTCGNHMPIEAERLNHVRIYRRAQRNYYGECW